MRDLPRGLDAVQLGHDQIHQDHVRFQGLRLGHSLFAVGSLADDLHTLLFGEQAHGFPFER